MITTAARAHKNAWQRRSRAAFAAARGYSSTADYSDGGLREVVLVRDQRSCVACGLSDAEHKAIWGRPITVDHIDKNRRNNALPNLQTLCLRCHGRKDLIPQLRIQKVAPHKAEILSWRAEGESYDRIAARIGVSGASIIRRWVKKWELEGSIV